MHFGPAPESDRRDGSGQTQIRRTFCREIQTGGKPMPGSTQKQTSVWRKLLLSLFVSLWCMTPALADGDRVMELERRVAELESMVRTLLEQQSGSGAAADAAARQAASDAALAREQVQSLAERAEPILSAAENRADKPEFFYGGFIKADFMVSTFDDGELSGNSIGRDFFVPSTIPVGGDSSTVFDAHARQTRFHFGTRHNIGEHKLGSYIEFDFLTTPGGDERVSNSYSPRMRHAYVTWNNWLVGQTWNTFMDVATLPESVDFIGPAGGTSFGRGPMVRYTNGGFAIALENAESTITPLGGGRIETDDNTLPELAARYTWNGDWGHLQLGGMLRQLGIDDAASGLDATTTGWGLSLSGKAMLGRDDIRFMVHAGEGLGRHVGLNFANGAALTDSGELDAIRTLGGFVAYRHLWTPQWRTNLALGYIEVDNPVQFTGTGVNESSWSGQINLFYSPTTPLSFGFEYLVAERELESGLSGQLNRFQFTTKYAF